MWSNDRIISFLCEAAVCMLHEVPGLDFDIDVSLHVNEQGQGGAPTGPIYVRNPHTLLMFMRIYLVARFILVRCAFSFHRLSVCLKFEDFSVHDEW